MNRFLQLVVFAALSSFLFVGVVAAQDTPWKVVQPGERFYDEAAPTAMTQYGEEIMLISLNPMLHNWTVAVLLEGSDDKTPIANVLSFGDAPDETYTLQEGDPKISINLVEDKFSVYSFDVPEDFILNAMKARYWNIRSDLSGVAKPRANHCRL